MVVFIQLRQLELVGTRAAGSWRTSPFNLLSLRYRLPFSLGGCCYSRVCRRWVRCGQVYLTDDPFVKGYPWGVVGIWNSNTRLFPGQVRRALIEARFGVAPLAPGSARPAGGLPNRTPSLRRWPGGAVRRGARLRIRFRSRRGLAPAREGRGRESRRGSSRRGEAGRQARRA